MKNENSPGGVPLRAAIHSLGCRLNHAESEAIRKRLVAAGYRIVPWGEPSDVCVLNTCTVTGQGDAKSRQALRAIRRRVPGAKIAMIGCYAQMAGDWAAQAGLADLVVGNGDKLRVDTYLDRLEGRTTPLVVRPPISREPFRMDVPAAPSATTRAHLKVQDGCDFMCSFCIIPFARGRARPRVADDLLREAEALVGAGTRELVLTGVNVGTYQEGGLGLEGIVDALDGLAGLARIRIGSIEPTTVAPALLERMADPAHRLVPFLHLPLQSGSEAVLRAMRRRHSAAEYRAFAEAALAAVPRLCLGTDVMAGFPGEDGAAFAETRNFLESLPFAYFHVFPYSARQGTPAARMALQVPARERRRRAAELRALSDAKRRAFQTQFLGRSEAVLFEQPKNEGMARGYTEHYIRVEVAAPDPAALRNRILPVRLTNLGDSARPHIVRGELLPELPLPETSPLPLPG